MCRNRLIDCVRIIRIHSFTVSSEGDLSTECRPATAPTPRAIHTIAMKVPPLYLTREAVRLGSARDLRRSAQRGALVRVATGVYIDSVEWGAMDADARYRTQVRSAALLSSHGAQFSHDSAAALYRLPSIGSWPQQVHELTARMPGGTSRRGIRRHGLGLDEDPSVIGEVTVTSLARTIVDLSCTTPFVRAVTMADAAMQEPCANGIRNELGVPAVTRFQLLQALESLLPYPGSARARLAIEFADGSSGSPGESFCRVQFHALGLPAPELQVEICDEFGSIGFADFYWRHLGLVCEYDGRTKYGALRQFQRNIPGEQVLWQEKVREDRMRRVVGGFARLTAEVVRDRHALADYLRPYGLVRQR